VTLPAGTKLGHYEVLALLGAGGMGEVYRARDEKLKRAVAIKVLPASLTQDAERMRRFEQEAQAAGGLNHPNITSVYELGEHDGSPYIVQELLEGETLRSRLAGGALPVRKATDYAIQVARGLAAAHEKGIVHRDLKPENLFVTKDGRVKILDFGLAKLTQADGAVGPQTNLPTAPPATEPGVVMGTLGYMSPEQVKGKSADARSDIFSFGAILYEALSGARAFHRDTAAETMSAILREDPPDLSATNKNVQPGLERVVRHCLEKNPEERFHSAADLAFDLESLSGASAPRPTVDTRTAPFRVGRVPVLIGLALAVAGMAATYWLGKRGGQVQPAKFHQLTFRRGTIASARFAPDGQTILYTSAWDGNPLEVFVSRLDSPESRPFGLANAEVLSVSPSGEMAVSLNRHGGIPFTRTGTLARLGMTGGGTPKEVLEDVMWADWGPDGQSLAVVRQQSGKVRLEYPVGKLLYETAGWISHPRISPKGDEVAFLDHPAQGDDSGAAAIVDLAAKRRTISEIFPSAQGLAWSADGSEVWFTAASEGFNRALRAATRSGGGRILAQATGGLTLQDVSKSGRVLAFQEKARQGISVLLPGSDKERDFSWLDWGLIRDVTADGQMILFDETGEGGGQGYSVYVRKADGSPAVRLGRGVGMELSADGRLALGVEKVGDANRLVIYPVGAGEPRMLPVTPIRIEQAGWLRDGRRLIFSGSEPDRGSRIWTQGLDEAKAKPISPEGYRIFGKGITSDGKHVVSVGPDQRFYQYPVEGGEPTPIAGLGKGDVPAQWTRDGRALYVRRRGDIPQRVMKLDVATGRKELWKELMPPDPAGVWLVSPVWVTPDEKYYVYGFARSLADLYVVDGLR